MPPATPCPTPANPRWLRPVAYGVLATFLLLLNAPVLEHGWVHFDDDINLFLHPRLTGGTWDTLAWAWQDLTYTRRFIPFGWMMFDGLFAVGGLQPFTYHAASWILAAVNAVLLLSVALVWAERRGRSTPNGILLAAAAIALAGVHPLLAETVGWASGLLYLGSTTWALAAIRLSLGPHGASPLRLSLATAAYAASLLTYPVHLALPLLVASSRWFFPGPGGRATEARAAARGHGPWLVIALVIGGLNLHAAATAGGGHTALASWGDFGLLERLRQGGLSLASYAGRLVQPGLTAIFYGDYSGPAPAPWLAALLTGSITALLAFRRTRPATAALLLLSLLALAPFLGLIDRQQTASDRYALPLIGLLTAASAAALSRWSPTRRQAGAAAAGLAVTIILTWPSYRTALAAWRSTDTVQTRLEAATLGRPNLRLGYTRPAMIDFLRGNLGSAEARLAEAERRFGPGPDIAATRQEIDRLVRELGRRSPEIRPVPYAVMHLDLARDHRTRGHAQAADEHTFAAERLLRAAGALRDPAPPPPAGGSER